MTQVHHDGGVLRRVDSLDGVRGLAVLFVLLYHTGQPVVSGFLLQSGVDLFFVLSGFLITTILLRTRDRSDYFRNFYGRRSVRIFPLYYLVLAVFVAGAWLAVRYGVQDRLGYPEAANMVKNQWWGWTYQVNNLEAFHGDIAFPGLPHLWSLAIEEQFYLVWPLVVLRAPRAHLAKICVAVAAASMVFRCVTYPLLGRDFAYHFTLARFDGLAIGAVGAVAVATPALRERLRPAVAWVGRRWWVVLLLVLMPEQAALYVGFTVLSVGYLGWILAAHDGTLTPRPTRWLHSRLLLELGTYSYAIYVFSLPISRVLIRINPTKVQLVDAALHVVGTAVLSYGLARVSWTLWERPWLRLKRRFSYG